LCGFLVAHISNAPDLSLNKQSMVYHLVLADSEGFFLVFRAAPHQRLLLRIVMCYSKNNVTDCRNQSANAWQKQSAWMFRYNFVNLERFIFFAPKTRTSRQFDLLKEWWFKVS
jgi:hypothetical protein